MLHSLIVLLNHVFAHHRATNGFVPDPRHRATGGFIPDPRHRHHSGLLAELRRIKRHLR